MGHFKRELNWRIPEVSCESSNSAAVREGAYFFSVYELYINIYTLFEMPLKSLPVMFAFHGGALLGPESPFDYQLSI